MGSAQPAPLADAPHPPRVRLRSVPPLGLVSGRADAVSSSSELRIISVVPATSDEWRRAWTGTPSATYFQSPEWAQVWNLYDPRRFHSAARRVTFSDGTWAILPLSRERRLGRLLERHVASPAGTFGGWLSETPLNAQKHRLLLRSLLDLGGSLVWRLNPYDSGAIGAAAQHGLWCRPDVTHGLRLAAGPEALLASLQNGYRKDIVRARKQGRIAVVPATTQADWEAYFRVYQDSLRRWGLAESAGYGYELFEALRSLNSSSVKLWLGLYDGAVVSGELCFYAERHAVSWHAAALESHLRTNVAKVQLMAVIEDACRTGQTYFDFNPSAGLAGVQSFKEGFNAEAWAAPLVYVDSLVKRCARRIGAGVGYGAAQFALEPLATWLERYPPPDPLEPMVTQSRRRLQET